MKQGSDPDEQVIRPVFKTDYVFCIGCERRMHLSLLDGGVTCRSCRNLNSDGTPKRFTVTEGDEDFI